MEFFVIIRFDYCDFVKHLQQESYCILNRLLYLQACRDLLEGVWTAGRCGYLLVLLAVVADFARKVSV